MTSYIWKPSTIHSWKKGIAFLAPDSTNRGENPYIIDEAGKRYDARYVNTNEGRHQWIFPSELANMNNLKVNFGGQTGTIGRGAMSYEGGGISDWQERSKGSLGDPGSMGGYPPGFAPGSIGYGAHPGYLGGMFPQPMFINYNPIKYKDIKSAPYEFTDPMEFSRKWGDFMREEIPKNIGLARDIALGELDTELEGLRRFVPEASRLKRDELALDNIFNIDERRKAVESTVPGAEAALRRQAQRAAAYAEGRVPDEIGDRALEISARSRATDRATAGGFGASSRVGRKISDLMSAESRIQLSQYGDQLVTQNLNSQANFFLPPTSYSDAGAQVRVTPEVGGARLQAGALSEVNSMSTMGVNAAFSGTVSQNQFVTGLEQQTRMFNAGNQLQTSMFNASNDMAAQQFNAQTGNQFALQKFAYDVGYAGTLAGAMQTDINTQAGLAQQAAYQSTFQDMMGQAQSVGQAGAIAQGIGSIPGVIAGVASTLQSIGAIGGGGGVAQVPGGTAVASAPPSPVANQGGGSFGGGGGGVSSGPVTVPAGSSVPSGYTPVASAPMPDGSPGVIAVPDSSMGAQMRSFAADTGLSLPATLASDPQQDVTKAMISQSAGALAGAGVYNEQVPGTQRMGTDYSGNPTYGNAQLMRSADTSLGTKSVNTLKQVLDPFGTFSRDDATAIDQIATVTGDAAFLAQLSALQQAGDSRGFVDTLLGRLGQPIIQNVTDDPQNQAGLSGAFTAYQLYQNWDRMSPAQKALGAAALGIQGYQFADGENLANKFIVKPTNPGDLGLTVGQALNLFAAGYNTYSLVKNWDQMNTLQKVAYGTGNVAQLANLGREFGVLGSGVSGAAVPNITAEALSAAGFSTVPQYGVGAIAGSAGSSVPAGYTAVATATDGGIIAVPNANLASAQGATGAGSLLGTAAGVAGVAVGAHTVYQGWGEGGKEGAINGVLGGSAMAAGLYALGATNPYLLAGVVAVSVAGNVMKTGKHEDQVVRDQVRSQFQSNGLIDDNYNLTLANGQQVNIGVDGRGGRHGFSNPNRISAEHAGDQELHSYDVDYTNDLDYASAMGGIALSRLLMGGKGKSVDQMGGQIGNAALSNVGFGKEMDGANYRDVMSNLRAFYAQSGIKSKADGYQLANQAYAEGRIDETDLVTTHQALNMIFDNNSFDTAQKLMAGRHRGIEVAKEDANKKPSLVPDVQYPVGKPPPLPNPGVGPGQGRPTPGNFESKPALTPRPIPRPTSGFKEILNQFTTPVEMGTGMITPRPLADKLPRPVGMSFPGLGGEVEAY